MKAALLVLALAACSKHEAPAPTVSSATQVDLARDLDAAARHGTWSAVRRAWQGKRLRWTVTRQAMLCASADACHVAAFPIQRPAQYGWMPALRFAPGEYEKLAATCGASPQCEIEIEGTLSELVASAEQPTHLMFSDVKTLSSKSI